MSTILAAGPDASDLSINAIQIILWVGIAGAAAGSVYLMYVGFFGKKSAIHGIGGILAGAIAAALFFTWSNLVDVGINTEKNIDKKAPGHGTGVLHPKK